MHYLIVTMVVGCIVLLLALPWLDPYLERLADWLEADPIGNKIGGWYDQYLSWVGRKQRKKLRLTKKVAGK